MWQTSLGFGTYFGRLWPRNHEKKVEEEQGTPSSHLPPENGWLISITKALLKLREVCTDSCNIKKGHTVA
jgi:hypothetical protein